MNWVVLLTVYIQIYGIYGKHRLWMEISNKCFEDNIKIEKVQPIGFFVVESENLKFQHAPCKTKAKRKRQATCRETKKHAEAFLIVMTLHMLGEIQLIKLQRSLPA